MRTTRWPNHSHTPHLLRSCKTYSPRNRQLQRHEKKHWTHARLTMFICPSHTFHSPACHHHPGVSCCLTSHDLAFTPTSPLMLSHVYMCRHAYTLTAADVYAGYSRLLWCIWKSVRHYIKWRHDIHCRLNSSVKGIKRVFWALDKSYLLYVPYWWGGDAFYLGCSRGLKMFFVLYVTLA